MSAGSQDPRRDWGNDIVFILHCWLWKAAGSLKDSDLQSHSQLSLTAQGHKLWGVCPDLFCLRPEMLLEGTTETAPRKYTSQTKTRAHMGEGK